MAIPEYNYIPKYTKLEVNNKPKDVVTASYWNGLFNSLSNQGDHTAKELGNILNHFSTELAGIENEIAESAEDIANIRGVFRINVTYSNGVYTADKTFNEIKAAYDAGQYPYVVSGSNTIYTLTDCYLATEQMAMDFKRYLIEADTLEDDTLRIYSYTTANGSNIVRQSTEFNIPIKVLEVTLTTQNGVTVADKTFAQVEAAVYDGIPVLKVHSDGALLWFFLLDKSPTEIDFIGLVDEQTIAYLTAKQDNTWETNVAARVTAEMLSSLNDKLGNLNELTTEAKNNLVAAINEAVQTGSGCGSTVELDTTLTQSGKAADAKAVGDALAGKQDSGNYVKSVNGTAPDESGNVTVETGGGGSGIYVGDTAPSDTSALWVDTSDNEGSTVDSVNGKTGTVVLTAEDVGAMPAGASVDYTLPVATAETLGGVKVGEGLSIDASGVLSASGGGSSGGGGGGVPTWSLLGEYDMSTVGDTKNITLTGLDNLTNLYFKFEALQNGSGNDSNYWLSINGKQLSACIISKKSGTSIYGYSICKWNGLVWEIQMSAGAISDTNYNLNNGNALFPYNHIFDVGACTELSVYAIDSTYKAVSGVLKIYGGK